MATETSRAGEGSEPVIVHVPAQTTKLKSTYANTVVCELRFPLLLELGADKAPAVFVNALRKRYPQMEQVNEFSVGPNGPTSSNAAHVFRSLRGGWTVTLKPASVAIEAKSYPGYEKFRERILEMIEAAAPVIDSSFWTRVGLRYINLIPMDTGHQGSDYVNPALVAPLDSGVFRAVGECSGKIRGGTEDHGYTLQHGIKREGSSKGTVELSYLIDVDLWRSEVELTDTMQVIDELHRLSFAVFDWSIGPVTRSALACEES